MRRAQTKRTYEKHIDDKKEHTYSDDIHYLDEAHCAVHAEEFCESGGGAGARIFYTSNDESKEHCDQEFKAF